MTKDNTCGSKCSKTNQFVTEDHIFGEEDVDKTKRVMISNPGNKKYPPNYAHVQCKDCFLQELSKEELVEYKKNPQRFFYGRIQKDLDKEAQLTSIYGDDNEKKEKHKERDEQYKQTKKWMKDKGYI